LGVLLSPGLSPQVGGLIALGQILPIGEGVAITDHFQIHVPAPYKQLSHSPAVLVSGLRLDHQAAYPHHLKQGNPGSLSRSTLGHFWSINASQADGKPLTATGFHPDSVSISNR
jgi:hypothetical protein